MQKMKSLESTRIITRTFVLGFIVFAVIVWYISKTEGIPLLFLISLAIGYILSLIWKKIDPVTSDDFSDNYREKIPSNDDLII